MALSANTTLSLRNIDGEKRYNAVIVSAAKIYKHAIVVRTAAGLFKPAANETTTTFAGIATAECDTGDGTVTCTVFTDVEILMTLVTAITAGDTNKTKLYAVDDASATSEATLGPEIGTMTEYVAANSGWINLRMTPLVSAS